MVKIVVITDIHANMPALEAVLKVVQIEGYDLLVQTGDAIAIGPYPAECVDLLLSLPRAEHIKGNHETYLVDGFPDPRVEPMSQGEVQHQLWTHALLSAAQKKSISTWPFFVEHDFEGVKAAFLHSGLGESRHQLQGIPRNASATDLDCLFHSIDADVIFYGHRHEASDLQGKARYINPGSLGCSSMPVARYSVLLIEDGCYYIDHHQVAYDDTDLSATFEARHVPDSDFIIKTFFGDRFHYDQGK